MLKVTEGGVLLTQILLCVLAVERQQHSVVPQNTQVSFFPGSQHQ
jgi:hypothetical protein